MKSVPHHLISIADPADQEIFSLSEYLKLARFKIEEIIKRKKIPFIVGGTGLYITSLLEGYKIPEVAPNKTLRKQLEKMSLEKLQDTYHALDPEGFRKIDISNPRRLMRAIEVVMATQKPFFDQQEKSENTFDYLLLGIKLDFEELKNRIKKRIQARFPAMLEEVKNLNKKGVPWERLESFGMEYKWMSKLAQGEIDEQTALQTLEKDIIAYSKRQLTWWRKRSVAWIHNKKEAAGIVSDFLKN